MSKINFELDAELRNDVGKGASRRLRRKSGLIPAIVYGAGKEPVNISLAHNKVIRALEDEAFYSHILILNINKKKEQVILKDLHRHPFKAQVMHMDFMRIKADEKLRMSIPLHFIGAEECAGVRLEGGVISHHMNEVEIICFPADLPEFINVDLTNSKLNDIIHLSQLPLPKGVELTAKLDEEGGDAPVASVHTPRVEEEISDAAPEAAETEITSEVPVEEGDSKGDAKAEPKKEDKK